MRDESWIWNGGGTTGAIPASIKAKTGDFFPHIRRLASSYPVLVLILGHTVHRTASASCERRHENVVLLFWRVYRPSHGGCSAVCFVCEYHPQPPCIAKPESMYVPSCHGRRAENEMETKISKCLRCCRLSHNVRTGTYFNFNVETLYRVYTKHATRDGNIPLSLRVRNIGAVFSFSFFLSLVCSMYGILSICRSVGCVYRTRSDVYVLYSGSVHDGQAASE